MSAAEGTLGRFKLSVIDPTGKPVSGVEPVTADDRGFFTLTLLAADYPELVKAKTDLRIRIVNADGKEVFAPDSTVKFEPGRISSFSAVVE